MKIKQDLLNIILICFSFYEPSIIPHGVFLAIKYLTVMWILLKYHDGMKRNKTIIVAVGMYGFITVLSSAYNRMAINTIVASIFFALQIIAVFLISENVIRKYGVMQYVKWLFRYFLVVCLFTDICMLFIGYDFSNAMEKYLIGNKFVVSYVHCFTAALAFTHACDTRIRTSLKGKIAISKTGISKRSIAYAIAIISMLICSKVRCSTGIISSALLIVLMLLPCRITQLLLSGKVMVIGITTINILMFGSYSLLTKPVVLDFVQNVLGKSGNFTGRTQIWAIIFNQIVKKPILGYGYYNDVINNLLGYGNPQNGVLKCLLDTGILGLVTYGFVIIRSFNDYENNSRSEIRPLISFFIVMLVASLAEINLTHMIVFLTMAITFYSSQLRKERGTVND